MRLLVCVPWFAPARAFGGTVTVGLAEVRGVLEAGHSVTVATTDIFDLRSRVQPGTPEQLEDVPILRFPNVSQRLAAANAPLPRGLRRWLRAHISEFDVVLLLDVYSPVSVLAARGAERDGVPYVLQALGTLPVTRERRRVAAKRAFRALWARRTVRRAAVCLYLSEGERAEYVAQGADPSRLHHVPPPLDLPEPGEIARAEAPTVVYLGQLHPIKRIGVLIDAFERVRRELPEARLEVIGAPSRHGEALRARAGPGVAFRGLIPEEEKATALGRAHVFSLLSAAEGLPVTVLEALSCGTPVVISPGCGLQELDGVAGIVCDGNADSAAGALLALLRDPGRAQRYGAAGRSFAAAYRREAVVPELVSLLERVATSSSNAA